MNLNNKLFEQISKNSEQTNNDYQIVFVSDYFENELVGGAELTSSALLEYSNYKILKLKSEDVSSAELYKFKDLFWIFTNISNLKTEYLIEIINNSDINLNYCCVEYDLKICKYRSPIKHCLTEKIHACNCKNSEYGKLIELLLLKSKINFFMSVKQLQTYLKYYPQLKNNRNEILSSVFNKSFFKRINKLNNNINSNSIDKYLIIGSNSWIKGTENAKNYCQSNQLKYDVVQNVHYDELLSLISKYKGFVFTPLDLDTCPRTVIEAKLLNSEIIINDNVCQKSESWFIDNNESTIQYLQSRAEYFWDMLKYYISPQNLLDITISGYTQTYNCISQNYPWEQSIESLLGFCDEVVIVDGGSSDGTWEQLLELATNNSKIKLEKVARDWSDERFSLYDGMQKAHARKLCTKDFCWQMDIDEVVHEDDYDKIKNLCQTFPKNIDLIALPVIDYWGRNGKVRIDTNPWKWRLSRNYKNITHGIPRDQRHYDENGLLYSRGSDGCDYIDKFNLERIKFGTFMTMEFEKCRQKSLNEPENLSHITEFESHFNNALRNFPSVHHYSWFNMERKVNTFKTFWSKYWSNLYSDNDEDTSENNMFFDKPWSEVTDHEISEISNRLENEMGGWIFHKKLDFNKPTPSAYLMTTHPRVMEDYQ